MELRRILVVAQPTPHGEAALVVATRLADARACTLRRFRDRGTGDELAREAQAWHADLLVLGSAEPSAIDTNSSISPLSVCEMSPCPVLVTRAGHERYAPRQAGFRRPVVGIDYSPLSEPAARLAISLTEPDGAVDLLHAFSPHPPGEGLSPGLERPAATPAIEDERTRELKRLFEFADLVDSPAVAVECHVEIGGAAHQVLEHIGRQENDLCALGAHPRATELQRALGTVTDRVLEHAPVPTLLFPQHLTTQARHRAAS
jgi:nucleotide-binding universal stress UspA family protein